MFYTTRGEGGENFTTSFFAEWKLFRIAGWPKPCGLIEMVDLGRVNYCRATANFFRAINTLVVAPSPPLVHNDS